MQWYVTESSAAGSKQSKTSACVENYALALSVVLKSSYSYVHALITHLFVTYVIPKIMLA